MLVYQRVPRKHALHSHLFMAQLAQLSVLPKGHGPRIYAPLMKKLDALRKEQQMECSVTNEQVTIWAGLILRGFTLW